MEYENRLVNHTMTGQPETQSPRFKHVFNSKKTSDFYNSSLLHPYILILLPHSIPNFRWNHVLASTHTPFFFSARCLAFTHFFKI